PRSGRSPGLVYIRNKSETEHPFFGFTRVFTAPHWAVDSRPYRVVLGVCAPSMCRNVTTKQTHAICAKTVCGEVGFFQKYPAPVGSGPGRVFIINPKEIETYDR